MKMLGLIGGTSWRSTIHYYEQINEAVNLHFGDNTNPPLLLFNLNQAQVHRHQVEDNWAGVAEMLLDAAQRLQRGGAEAVLFCANTPHKVYDSVNSQIGIPILHIADATARAIQKQSIRKVGFVGTKFSMEEDFIQGRIANNGIEVITPEDPVVINELHRIIQKELTFGRIEPASKRFLLKELEAMIEAGAKGIVLGCTEFPLMITDEDLTVPIFNTTVIHAQEATGYILDLEH